MFTKDEYEQFMAQFRCRISSGFILGRPMPLAPVNAIDCNFPEKGWRVRGLHVRTPEQIAHYREGARRGWLNRRRT